MPRILRIPLLLLIAGIAACGQKGPLILPDSKTAAPVSKPASVPVPVQPASAPDDKKDKSRPR
jgi:predicted small lipoprotein YifL